MDVALEFPIDVFCIKNQPFKTSVLKIFKETDDIVQGNLATRNCLLNLC